MYRGLDLSPTSMTELYLLVYRNVTAQVALVLVVRVPVRCTDILNVLNNLQSVITVDPIIRGEALDIAVNEASVVPDRHLSFISDTPVLSLIATHILKRQKAKEIPRRVDALRERNFEQTQAI